MFRVYSVCMCPTVLTFTSRSSIEEGLSCHGSVHAAILTLAPSRWKNGSKTLRVITATQRCEARQQNGTDIVSLFDLMIAHRKDGGSLAFVCRPMVASRTNLQLPCLLISDLCIGRSGWLIRESTTVLTNSYLCCELTSSVIWVATWDR